MDEPTGPPTPRPTAPPTPVGGSSRFRHRWGAAAVVLLVLGSAGTAFAANGVARNAQQGAQSALQSSSTEIAGTLQLAIQRESDLTVSAAGFVASNPNVSNRQFGQWVSSINSSKRYPELRGIGYIAKVSAAALPAFIAQEVSDPSGPLAANGTFQVTPAGSRPFYCFAAAEVSTIAGQSVPADLDYCSIKSVSRGLLSGQDSGQGTYAVYTIDKQTLLTNQSPVYRDGMPLATVPERQAAILGWIGTVLEPNVVLGQALHGHPGTALTFSFHSGSLHGSFRGGAVLSGAQSTTISLHNGWSVKISQVSPNGGLLTNGNALALLLVGVALSALLGALVFVLGTGRARARRVVAEQTGELRHQALHDALTGLPNRTLILDRIEQLLARSRRQGTLGAVLYVDLDDFKDVNDTLGHAAGDRLLVAVAARLQGTLRDADTIGRMGGDEFVVLIDGASLEAGPELVAERLLDVMRQPFELDGASMPIMVNVSVGIAVGDRANPGELLRDADVALYQAKSAGKNRYEIFHPEMQSEISHRIELEFDLRSALEGDQFRLVYQPIYNLDELTLIGVEALLRWEHPTLGLMQPDEFIPILEQTGRIREVGRWVLNEACRQMATWHAQGDTLDISVNVSGRQLDDDAIVVHVRDALAASGLDPKTLIIEVTETALMRNAESTAGRLQAIKDLGVKIAVDDFGTGYSSLAYLRQFPVDCIKIDRMFTNAITTSPESKALIGTLVQLGRDLGLKTLAEGVETTEEMDHLRHEEVNEAQGFLFARPLDAETLERKLLEPNRTPVPSDRAT
jgi:diguanylate cyclase (GGDEF)-like protein